MEQLSKRLLIEQRVDKITVYELYSQHKEKYQDQV